jgi:hypothetical protein
MNLSAISCSTAPSGFSRITEDKTVNSPLNLGQIFLLALAELMEIRLLARNVDITEITINLLLLFSITFLSVEGDHPVAATVLSEIAKN